MPRREYRCLYRWNKLTLSLSIGVLDIAGFEIFGKNPLSDMGRCLRIVQNSYEQLLINFTNEKLVSLLLAKGNPADNPATSMIFHGLSIPIEADV